MLLNILVIMVSFALVIAGANWLVSGAADLARRLRLPPLLIGLTVVAFGTSLPELSINLFALRSGRKRFGFR